MAVRGVPRGRGPVPSPGRLSHSGGSRSQGRLKRRATPREGPPHLLLKDSYLSLNTFCVEPVGNENYSQQRYHRRVSHILEDDTVRDDGAVRSGPSGIRPCLTGRSFRLCRRTGCLLFAAFELLTLVHIFSAILSLALRARLLFIISCSVGTITLRFTALRRTYIPVKILLTLTPEIAILRKSFSPACPQGSDM